MTTQKKLLILSIILIGVIVAVNSQLFHRLAIETFKLNNTLITYYSDDELDGKATVYVDGRVESECTFRDRKKNGWEIAYYNDGIIKSKTFMVNGVANGRAFAYNIKGQLEHEGFLLNDKPYGSWYKYYPDGSPMSYVLADINGQSFSVNYDSVGNLNLKEMDGFVVSPDLYTIDKFEGTPVLLKSYPEVNDSRLIKKDLLITVANLKGAKLKVTVDVNGRVYEFPNIKTNTLKIKNVLNKVTHKIFIESHLYNKDDTAINGINIKRLFVVK